MGDEAMGAETLRQPTVCFVGLGSSVPAMVLHRCGRISGGGNAPTDLSA